MKINFKKKYFSKQGSAKSLNLSKAQIEAIFTLWVSQLQIDVLSWDVLGLQSVELKHKYTNPKHRKYNKKIHKDKKCMYKYQNKKLQIQQIDVLSWDAWGFVCMVCWAQAFASFHFFRTTAKTGISTNTEQNTKIKL